MTDQPVPALEPCPLCKSKNVHLRITWPECLNCRCTAPGDKWNNRPHPAPDAVVEALREALAIAGHLIDHLPRQGKHWQSIIRFEAARDEALALAGENQEG